MVQVHEVVVDDKDEVNNSASTTDGSVCMINENRDVLIEILKRVDDDRSLGVAACVCRLWCELNDAVWEHLCFRQYSPPTREGVRRVVVALGGYHKLYMSCVKPVHQLGNNNNKQQSTRPLQLSLSLFCVDYYERVLLTGADSASSSLMFLHKAVNV